MVNYEAQVNQMPTPYLYSSPASSKKRQTGLAIAGGLIGMNAYYIPVKKDTFVNRGFEMKRTENFDQIVSLRNIAEEVEKNKLSNESKMILEQLGVSADISAITRKCDELEKEVTDSASVKRIKDSFIDSFDRCKKNTHLMDSASSDAYKAVRRSKFWWGAGIGAGIGLALGLLGSRN